jgi:hypothetical protein
VIGAGSLARWLDRSETNSIGNGFLMTSFLRRLNGELDRRTQPPVWCPCIEHPLSCTPRSPWPSRTRVPLFGNQGEIKKFFHQCLPRCKCELPGNRQAVL